MKLTQKELKGKLRKIVENSCRDIIKSKMLDESKSRKNRKSLKEDVEGSNFQIIPIHSLNQMRKYTEGTNWCLSKRKFFDIYASKGSLFILLNGSEKYCAFVVDGQIEILADEGDRVFEPNEVLPQDVIAKLEGGITESKKKVNKKPLKEDVEEESSLYLIVEVSPQTQYSEEDVEDYEKVSEMYDNGDIKGILNYMAQWDNGDGGQEEVLDEYDDVLYEDDNYVLTVCSSEHFGGQGNAFFLYGKM